jgi:hypothetical protein
MPSRLEELQRERYHKTSLMHNLERMALELLVIDSSLLQVLYVLSKQKLDAKDTSDASIVYAMPEGPTTQAPCRHAR